ncbi:MAG: phosphotransferase [Pseudomonadota bacterium]
MTDRDAQRRTFIDKNDWAKAETVPVAGDASNRRYDRLIKPTETCILMDAPPEKGEDVGPFVRIAQHLKNLGFSAPKILAEDPVNGFLLLEDLGDDLFSNVLVENSSMETMLYEAAVDVLVTLHRSAAPRLPRYDATLMTELALLAFDWYARGAAGAVDQSVRSRFERDLKELLVPLDRVPGVLIQRDYHADNLIWLPERDGIARVGLLDFQDALLGHPAYDLVSILQDARRDVPPSLQQDMINRYVTSSGADEDEFRFACAALGLQRNLRILGVFARLAISHGKPRYVEFIPRVWSHIETCLKHPGLEPIKPQVFKYLPAPDKAVLDPLREPCTTVPMH